MKTNPRAPKPPADEFSPTTVLAQSLLTAGTELGLSTSELAAVLGLHRSAVSRLKKCPNINPDSKQGELALMLIRIYRALHALTDGNPQWMQHFMREPNSLTGDIPARQIQEISGLMRVMFCTESLQYPAA